VKAYVIYQSEVLNPKKYEAYKSAVSPNIVAAGGRYLVRGGDPESLEGAAPLRRTVILEFPSRQAVLVWYHSDEYREIRKLRDGAANAAIYIVDGIE